MKEEKNMNYSEDTKLENEKNKDNISKIKRKQKKEIRKYIVIFLLLCIVILLIYLKYKQVFETKKTYTVINGNVEKLSDTIGILIKNETIVETDSTKSIIPVIEQYKRVGKNGIIATYKDENYDKYLEEISGLDKTIETLVKDLPNTYSTEISNINKKISSLAKEAKNANSYLKIQEYKNKLDELSYKKVSLLGEYSPEGSKIRELIAQREKIEKSSVKSSNNIIANVSGVVTYKIDKLENKVDENTILKFSDSQIDELFSDYSKNKVNKYGVKIVDNYTAYFVIKTPINENKEYIKEGLTYTIKTNEQDIYEFDAKLVKNISNEKYNYTIFKIENGIENIVDYRTIGLEIIWNKTEGLAVPKSAITKSDNEKYDYVTLVYGGKYVDIPVKIVSSDENICIVENYNKDEIEKLGITREYELSLYDIIVIK